MSNSSNEVNIQSGPQVGAVNDARAQVDALVEKGKVRLVDQVDGMVMFCYDECSNAEDPMVQQTRGVVFRDDQLVMQAFPYTVEMTSDEVRGDNFQLDVANCTFFDSQEGFLIRMFWSNNVWYMSTHRKFNAMRSRWASRETFGEMFIAALEAEAARNDSFRAQCQQYSTEENPRPILEAFQMSLNPSLQYMFLVRNSDASRIVCNAPETPTMYHVGTFDSHHQLHVGSLTCGIAHQQPLQFADKDALVAYVNACDPRHTQGVICFAPANRQVKILNPLYKDLTDVRGNQPSIKFRYLQVRNDVAMVDRLLQLYPHMKPEFDEYDANIDDIAVNIFQAYTNRFIRKMYVKTPQEEYGVIRACHGWHIMDRRSNRVTLAVVKKHLLQQTPVGINHMIKHLRADRYAIEAEKEAAKKAEAAAAPEEKPEEKMEDAHVDDAEMEVVE
jgi:hypothetical protein